MTRIFLATAAQSPRTLLRVDWSKCNVGVLVALPYLAGLRSIERQEGMRLVCRPKMLDSGAFTAWNAGHEVDYEGLCREAATGEWDEVVALDVIGDAIASRDNALKMRDRGLTVMPVFHFGEPWHILETYKREGFARIGIAGGPRNPRPDSLRWFGQVFSRAWPHAMHCFGWTPEDVLVQFPFASADSSSWQLAPTAFGRWKAFGNQALRINSPQLRSTRTELMAQVDYYQRLQNRVTGAVEP